MLLTRHTDATLRYYWCLSNTMSYVIVVSYSVTSMACAGAEQIRYLHQSRGIACVHIVSIGACGSLWGRGQFRLARHRQLGIRFKRTIGHQELQYERSIESLVWDCLYCLMATRMQNVLYAILFVNLKTRRPP